ncbi:malonyl-CoA synthase [Paralimibaculum aggregatum]|uniref:Malonyl-CoA synthase n=1 Tax=Paralimibaculum aggregatum TaxID=3036245 RepID=A0ABQ6LQU0_9RHOB|nr:malonyl-CoA synthase [Limibaculum sp. NKW23]GMG83226.1 malonyl-CoA synthase [Limibaculum sp. NKW23]
MTNHLADTLGLSRTDRATHPFAELRDGRHFSYGDVTALSARMAAAVTGLGVKPGDRVAVQVDKSIEALMLYLGVIRAGAVFLPLNTGYTAQEIDYFVGNAEPSLLVCAPGRREALEPVASAAGCRLETLGVWQDDGGEHGSLLGHVPDSAEGFADVPRGPEDLAAILYTSGTTGRSKGAMLSHDNLASNALVLRDFWQFTADDVLLHALPIFHTHGLFVATNTTLVAGGALLFREKFDAGAVLEDLPRATAMMGVPTFYTRLLAEPGLSREAVKNIRVFISGSAPLLAETHRDWQARTGHAILERYGMTETSMNSSNPYDGERRAGTVGFPLPGTEVVVTDPETGVPLPAGEIGMVEVRGPNVFKGYWRMPEKTAEELRETGFFITGDLGRYDADGYLSIVGRSKDLIISGGYNVYPKEIETAIDAIEGVVESAVIGLPHPDFGEGVAAVVVRSDPGLSAETLLGALEGQLARFKQPKRVFFEDELPRNTMGKVEKKALRERFAGTFQG